MKANGYQVPPGHPCAGHGCDGCSICQAGGCCGQQAASVTTVPDGINELRLALTRVVAERLDRPFGRNLLLPLARKGTIAPGQTLSLAPGGANFDDIPRTASRPFVLPTRKGV
jgi:hypothetical protein